MTGSHREVVCSNVPGATDVFQSVGARADTSMGARGDGHNERLAGVDGVVFLHLRFRQKEETQR